jgi:hypothetical protein
MCLQFQISKRTESNCTDRINDELKKTGVAFNVVWEKQGNLGSRIEKELNYGVLKE